MMGQTTICDAIKRRHLISFSYKGQLRTVEPHLLGYDKSGDLTLCAWQVSGPKPGWRDFHVAKLSALSITERTFERARQGYNPQDRTMSGLVCRL